MRSSARGRSADHTESPTRRIRALYVHSPFCRRRCTYCDFAIAILRSRADLDRFLDGLALELDQFGSLLEPRTLYVGGGTPSRLAPSDLREFFARLDQRIHRRSLLEFTVEANPEDVTLERAEALVESGVTRVSLGVQSMDPTTLALLGRRHTPHQVREAVTVLRESGIASINVDLIYAIPGQDLLQLTADLKNLIDLSTDHVSAYNLTFEERTPLQSLESLGRIARHDPDFELEAFRLVRERLETAGYAAYEISNFARPRHQSLHNLMYWTNQEYIGVGPSAVSCVGHVRWRNDPDLQRWWVDLLAGRRPVIDAESLSADRFVGESLALGLRTSRGVLRSRIERRARAPLGSNRTDRLAALVRLGLVEETGPRLRLTTRGLEIADSVAAELI